MEEFRLLYLLSTLPFPVPPIEYRAHVHEVHAAACVLNPQSLKHMLQQLRAYVQLHAPAWWPLMHCAS
jgi:hypothetical protein